MLKRAKPWLMFTVLMVFALVSGIIARRSLAQEPAASAAASAAPAPATPPAPDPMTAPTAGDSTGANYTGANTTATLTGDKDEKTGKIKVTPETLAADVKNIKIGMNIFWTLVC